MKELTEMEYVTLNTGAKMPMLGFGVFRLEDKNAIPTAISEGYRCIDTAAGYNNEELVGQAVSQSGIKREEFFITTKLSNGCQRAGNVEGEFEESLKKLGMDYVDLYLVHWPVKEHYVDTWLTLEKLYKTGRTKAIGVSNFHDYHIDAIKKVWSIVPALNQVELHPRLTQKPLSELCKKDGIVVQAWSPLGGGKPGDPGDIKGNLLGHEVLAKIGEKYGKTPAQVILRWDLDTGIATIPKSITPSRIKSNIDVFDFNLTSEEIAAIDALNLNQRTGSDPDNFTH